MTLIRESAMPRTRLELRWSRTDDPEWRWRCDYNLVIELWRLDRRGEVYDDDGLLLRRERELVINVGSTRADGDHNRLHESDQRIDTPFRDGAHIQWDNWQLGGLLPMFAVCSGYAMPIALRPRPSHDDKDEQT